MKRETRRPKLGEKGVPQWEYRIRKTDLKALNQSSFLELEQMRLSECGEDGWELVSAVPSQNGESLILFLKRPVEEAGRDKPS